MSNTSTCPVCGQAHASGSDDSCPALKAAADEGAHPRGVPIRVYGGYLEARAALKKNAPVNATRTLQWLLGYLAEERGAPAESTFEAKLLRLCEINVISPRVRDRLLDAALSAPPEQAWALMSIVEHALTRLYLQPFTGRSSPQA